jgi:hypothetical protein
MAEKSGGFRIAERLIVPTANYVRAIGNSVLQLLIPGTANVHHQAPDNEIRRMK